MMRVLAAAISMLATLAAVAAAQSDDEIVVTGSRLQRYAADVVPSVALERNADFVLISYDFICDTRDKAQRVRELTRTLENLIAAAARRDDIELSTLVEYEDDYDTLYFPKPYAAVNENDFKVQYGRDDTSVQRVVVKTPVNDGATIEGASARITAFAKSLKVEGRTIAVVDGDPQLSIVNVERYRPELTAAIRADAAEKRAALGAATTEISGLEQVVRWERSGPLELKIYIPYKLGFTIEQ